MPREELPAEAARRFDRLVRVAQHVAASVAVAMHHADEIGTRVAGEFLDLADDGARDHGEGLLRREHEPDALALHALDDLGRAGIGGGVVAEGAIEKGLELRRAAVPIDRRRGDEAMGREIAVEEHGAEAVLDRALAVDFPAFPAVSEKPVQEIVGKQELSLVAGFRQSFAYGFRQQRRIAVSAWTR